jgi:hypothetical protein
MKKLIALSLLALTACEIPEITIETYDAQIRMDYDVYALDSVWMYKDTLYNVQALSIDRYTDSIASFHNDTVYVEGQMKIF